MLAVDPVLLTIVQISTSNKGHGLSNATGFFYEVGESLYLVSNRHVFIDEPSEHFPDSIQVAFHVDEDNLADCQKAEFNLYENGTAKWIQGRDTASEVDVAVLPLDKSLLPAKALYRSFTPEHLRAPKDIVLLGSPLIIIGFPLGFHDGLHQLPVARNAIVASPFGLRFQGMGYFLTDARTHRGSSGAPVLIRKDGRVQGSDIQWQVAGIHSARFDVGTRDKEQDEALGLNCAWYTDILNTLTE